MLWFWQFYSKRRFECIHRDRECGAQMLYVCCVFSLLFESLVLLRDAAHEDLIEYPSNEGGNAVL